MPQFPYLGLDVARAHLDVAVHPTQTAWRVPNTPAGHAALVRRARALQPTRIVLEASGGYEQAVDAALITAGLPAVVVNPRQVRDFARSRNILAKTDRRDAWGSRASPPRSSPRCARAQMPPPNTCTPWSPGAGSCWACGWPSSSDGTRPHRPSAPTSTPTSPG